MKRSLLFMVMLFAISSAFSQSNPNFLKDYESDRKKKTGPGILFHGGVNFSGIGGESNSYSGAYSGTLPGVYFGASVNVFNFNKLGGIHAGVFYSQQGSKYKSDYYIPGGETGTGNGSVRLNYLGLPVTAKYQAKNGFFGEAGIRPALLLSAKDKFNGESQNIKSNLNSFDMGLELGAGYQFKNNIGIEVYYNPGLVNINKTSTYSLKNKNRNISLGVYYAL